MIEVKTDFAFVDKINIFIAREKRCLPVELIGDVCVDVVERQARLPEQLEVGIGQKLKKQEERSRENERVTAVREKHR